MENCRRCGKPFGECLCSQGNEPPAPFDPPGKSEQEETRDYSPIPPKSETTLTARVVDAKRGEPMPYDSEQQHTPLTETRNPLSQQERAAIRKEPHTVLVEWLLDDLEAAERTIAELGARELLYIKQGVLLAEAERERDEAKEDASMSWGCLEEIKRFLATEIDMSATPPMFFAEAIIAVGHKKSEKLNTALLAANRTIAELMEAGSQAQAILKEAMVIDEKWIKDTEAAHAAVDNEKDHEAKRKMRSDLILDHAIALSNEAVLQKLMDHIKAQDLLKKIARAGQEGKK